MSRRSNSDGAIIVALIAGIAGMFVGFYKYPIPTAIAVLVLGLVLFPDNAEAVIAVAAIGGGIGWFIKKSQTTAVVQTHQKQIEDKYGQRNVDHNLSLIERNKDIIEKNLQGMYHDTFRYYVENKIRDCISDIAIAEGKPQFAAKHEYLSTWSQKVGIPREYIELKDYLETRFKARFAELKDKEKKRQEESDRREQRKTEDSGRKLAGKYSALIDKFLEVAERRVSTLDEYGDENWDALTDEIKRVMRKIVIGDGKISEKDFNDYLKGNGRGWNFPDEYEWLMKELQVRFKEYHKEHERSVPRTDYSSLSGIEFENHLLKVFKEGGYEVAGTPATGDQGADLIAKKNGKTLIIQAKRYAGSVGNKAVQEIAAAVQFYGGDEGWVITNSTFTPAAKALAQKSKIRLIGGFDLAKLAQII